MDLIENLSSKNEQNMSNLHDLVIFFKNHSMDHVSRDHRMTLIFKKNVLAIGIRFDRGFDDFNWDAVNKNGDDESMALLNSAAHGSRVHHVSTDVSPIVRHLLYKTK
jgi:hypothetical protein